MGIAKKSICIPQRRKEHKGFNCWQSPQTIFCPRIDTNDHKLFFVIIRE
ncbi:MAG: hypothetical protein LBK06_09650 [Planctomycetaceae bacterium]|nr:hypothetical protein [Planctomycetaceae bacterium]